MEKPNPLDYNTDADYEDALEYWECYCKNPQPDEEYQNQALIFDLCIEAKDLVLKLLPPEQYEANAEAERLYNIIFEIMMIGGGKDSSNKYLLSEGYTQQEIDDMCKGIAEAAREKIEELELKMNEELINNADKYFRCGFCGTPYNSEGNGLNADQLKGREFGGDIYGECCYDKNDPESPTYVTRDMAIDAGDLSLECEVI